jgi:hypothetical protein
MMRRTLLPFANFVALLLFTASLAFSQPVNPPNPDLGPDQSICPGTPLTLNPYVNYQLHDDTLVIDYNATLGQTALVNANKVYIHSTYELAPFGGPVNPWIGNWGQDDGLGQMTETAPDQWQIRIHIPSYYNIAPGTNINGLFMVFRNEDGTATGKDDNGNDIFMLLSGANPSSAFSGVQGTRITDGISSFQWSTGATSPTIQVNNPGTYGVAVTFSNSTVAYDTIIINSAAGLAPSLGNDFQNCSANLNITLDPGNNYSTYLWNTGSTDSILVITTPGTYWVQTSVNGCTASDTITITQGAPIAPISLGNDTLLCGAGVVVLNPGVTLSPAGDSLTIVYDATQGQTGLVGANKVYMHSGVEFVPFGGWGVTVGNWGQDDGIGLMDSIGANLWRITINIPSYYNIPQGQGINGLLMVFRNADGTATGKDQNGNDIFINMTSQPPVSAFTGVTPTYTTNPYTSIVWSDNSTASTLTVSTPGTYFATVTTNTGCTLTDTIQVGIGNIPIVDAGASQNICDGQSVSLNAGPGFNSYNWSTGDTTAAITVNQTGTYTLTVTNSDGCQGIDVINISILPEPVAAFTWAPNAFNPFSINFTNTSSNGGTYAWDFNNDGVTDATSANPFYTYLSFGTYTVRLIVNNICGTDTIVQQIVVTGIGEADMETSVQLYPNPAAEGFRLQFPYHEKNVMFYLHDAAGRVIISGPLSQDELQGNAEINISELPSGTYIIRAISDERTYSNFLIKP